MWFTRRASLETRLDLVTEQLQEATAKLQFTVELLQELMLRYEESNNERRGFPREVYSKEDSN